MKIASLITKSLTEESTEESIEESTEESTEESIEESIASHVEFEIFTEKLLLFWYLRYDCLKVDIGLGIGRMRVFESIF